MRRTGISVALGLMLSACASSPRSASAPDCSRRSEPADRAALIKMSRARADACRAGDAAWYERNLAADAIIALPDGAVHSRREAIAALADRRDPVESLDVTHVVLHVYCNAAVETGIETVRDRDADGVPVERRYRHACVYIRSEGRWLVALDQLTSLP